MSTQVIPWQGESGEFIALPMDQFKQLKSAQMKEYLLAKQKAEGAADEPGVDPSLNVPSMFDLDSEDSPAMPPKEVQPPPGTPRSEESPLEPELPPSAKGELGELTDPEPEEPKKEEAKEGDEPSAQPETPPEPFLDVSDQTRYNSREDAIKGIQEKDRVIAELQAKEREREEEVASYKRRLEADKSHEELETETTAPVSEPKAETVEEQKYEPVEEPKPEELYDLFEDTERGGPLEVVRRCLDYELQDLRPLIDLVRQLKEMGAPAFIESMQALNAEGMMRHAMRETLYDRLDNQYPQLEGNWHNPDHEMAKLYTAAYKEVSDAYQKAWGQSLDDLAGSNISGTEKAIKDTLDHMVKSGMVDKFLNGEPSGEPPVNQETTPSGGGEPSHTEPVHTEAAVPKREDVAKLVREEVKIVTDAIAEQGRLHGGSMEAGARGSDVGEGEKKWTQEMIRRDPQGFAEWAKKNPAYQKASLDLLPNRS